MFVLVQKPREYFNDSSAPAPTPFRSDYWDNVVHKEFLDEYTLALSTKSAIYSGILSIDVADLKPECHTANCTWPVFPTLGVCGQCASTMIKTTCTDTTQPCVFETQHNTNMTVPQDIETDSFKIMPLQDQPNNANETRKTFVSIFELMMVSNRTTGTKSSAFQCGLWFCVKLYALAVEEGKATQTIVGVFNDTHFETTSGTDPDEHVFDHPQMSTHYPPNIKHSVSDRAVKAIRSFMDSLTQGHFQYAPTAIYFSSDWIEAMWQASADPESWVNRISRSLTNEVRVHGRIQELHSKQFEGHASRMAGYVHVQ
ncbi:hypothetical protein QQS21_003188 [Conoideocrella luteorostrata]|uniref:Uncharacterized protein n=1 Tax=Conoideocrella luteorostrata TaxID=1105319 RepID=A0AAJ0CW82_9HYPO|nr:hypothetical protein QQS21_003188 [Conoideocrella luteorostrata]